MTLFTYKLKTEVWKRQNAIEEKSKAALLANRQAEITEDEQRLLNLPYEVKCPGENAEKYSLMRDSLAEHYKKESEEKKLSTWLYEKDHPEGVLCKSCPVCGYKFGSAWKFVEVPQSAIDFLMALPDTDSTPAWV